MYFVLLSFIISSSFAAPDIEKLAASPKWMKLLHYKKEAFGGYKSEADSKSFFLAPDGKTNPFSELKRSIALFGSTSSPDDKHPICRFPLRYKWLNKELGIPWKADFSGCKNYLEFFSKIAAKRASVVFSSYYLRNPNSAFGHTLLRFSRFDDENETEMLDYGINYAANSNESNPLLYAVKGLFGGFEGKFTALPYYYKIREYNDAEFRDLWSYELNMSFPEVLEMVDHVWELGNTTFDYYYFRENCSYHLLSVLEAARPSLNLTGQYDLYAIPADTLRLLKREGLITSGRMRESAYSRLTRTAANLNSAELKKAKSIALYPLNAEAAVKGLTDQRAAVVLDTAMEAFDYYHAEKILKDDLTATKLKSHILLARAKNPVISFPQTQDRMLDSPDLSHSPARASLAPGYIEGYGRSLRFEFRAALHDLLDPPAGSMNEARLEIGKISFGILEKDYEEPKPLLYELSLLEIGSYQEQNFWTSPFSWEAGLGVKQLWLDGCFDCPAAYTTGSIGNSLQLLDEKLLLSFFVNGELDIQAQFINNYRFGIGPKALGRFSFSEKWMMGMSSRYHLNTYHHERLLQDYEWWNDLELRHHISDKFSLSLKAGAIERERMWISYTEIGLQYFYE